MRAFVAFTKKELCEMTRTYKVFIILSVFVLLGMMNPLTAKIMPQLMEDLLPEGMLITMADPTALDSWMQFYKNVPQMGLIVVVILFSGMMANEFQKGTLIPLLTKGLKRSTVILSKFITATLLWTLSYGICFLISYGYTLYFWGNEGITHLLFSVFCLWVFGVLIIAALVFFGVLSKNNYGSLLGTGAMVMGFFFLNIVPKCKDFNPIRLASDNVAILTGEVATVACTKPLVVSIVLCILFLTSAIAIFNKRGI